jgi:polyferredoxin
VRGEGTEGRGKIVKNEDRLLAGKGNCIDCKLCVSVCPVGIDIRNGTQLECTNCTACIDECNSIMSKVGFPEGLIRYASEDEIVKKEKFVFTARMKSYTAVLLILIGIFNGMMFLRTDIEATVLRLPGQLFEHKAGKISNVFTYKLVNKTMQDFENVHIELAGIEGEVKIVGKPVFKIGKEGTAQGTMFIEIIPALLQGDKTTITLEVYDGDRLIDTETTNFLGPRTFN